ncbi:hypothetical protein [Micromonospora purpureochromogenes]|uniref:Uncharacterized protein n=1 Tax=Micromonospora purpureochromogenes TaxID=47872 RepID=A0ABX2RL53_9ACTN|nr:hypothetical protein [Micromonospora purpureochromogenes]NYF57242.1 hypothetical protein [Micromonospora purpureochromogenes]
MALEGAVVLVESLTAAGSIEATLVAYPMGAGADLRPQPQQSLAC